MKSKKFICLLVVFMLLATGVFASGKGETGKTEDLSNVNVTGLPIVSEPVTLNFMARIKPMNSKPYKDMPILKEYEELTNVHIEWTEVQDSAWNEKLNLVFASGDLPDAIYPSVNDDALILRYGSQGQIIPLEDLIEKWAPNLSKILKERPDLKSFITAPDGHIYALPVGEEAAFLNVADNLFIDKIWLDKLGLSIPKTTEEFYQVLKAFKEKDPNGNGKADEIPLSFVQEKGLAFWINSMFGSFGVLDNALHLMVKDGKVLFSPSLPGYKEGITYFHKLADEGLLDPESFTQNYSQFTAKGKMEETVLGSIICFLPHGIVGTEKVDKEYVVVGPLAGPGGDRLWNKNPGIPGLSRSGFAITSANKHPEATMRWIDQFMDSSDNAFIIQMGHIGWDRTDSGQWFATSEGDYIPKDMSWGEWRHIDQPGSSAAYLMVHPEDRKLDKNAGAKESFCVPYRPYFPKEVVPSVYMDPDAQNELTMLSTDINSYVEHMKAKWILDGGVDAEWEKYLGKLQDMNVDRYVEIYQEVFDRVNK